MALEVIRKCYDVQRRKTKFIEIANLINDFTEVTVHFIVHDFLLPLQKVVYSYMKDQVNIRLR